MSDDHGSQAMSIDGSRTNQTLQIDGIAQKGMRFDNCTKVSIQSRIQASTQGLFGLKPSVRICSGFGFSLAFGHEARQRTRGRIDLQLTTIACQTRLAVDVSELCSPS